MNRNNQQQLLPAGGRRPLMTQTQIPGVSIIENNQSGSGYGVNRITVPVVATETLNNMTVIRSSPGTTTDVIIRPVAYDASVLSPQQRLSASPGRTHIFNFPSTGDFDNVQVQQGRNQYFVPQVSSQRPYALPGSRQHQQCQTQPGVKALFSYPVTNVPVEIGQDKGQPFVEQGQLCPMTSFPPSPYNLQNDRRPLPGMNNVLTQFPPQTLVDSTILRDQVVYTSGSNDQFTPYKRYLQQTLSGIQLLSEDMMSAPKGSTKPTGFDALVNTCHIFIEPAKNSFPDASLMTVNKFNLIDSYGSRLFFAFEKRTPNQNRCCGGCCGNSTVSVSVMQASGVECMMLNGNTSIVAFRVPGTDGALHTLGYVMEDTKFCSMNTNYLLKDKHGNLCFKLLREKGVSNPTDIEIFGNDEIRIGRLGKFWGNLPDSPTDLSHNYGVSFPKDMNTDEKGLMIGALISIYWKYFVDTTRDQRIARSAWCCVTGCTVFILLVILGFAFLAAHVVRQSS